MSPDLEALIEQYRAGLEAEIVLLRRLELVSDRQSVASATPDFKQLNETANVRDRLTSALVNIEDGLRDVRRRLSEAREEARQLPGYEEALALHHEAVALVTKILGSDKASLESLASAELVRRDELRAIEQGETTLSAYRKVVSLSPSATLVNRRG
ncbi:MAG: hypothetical protein HOP16_00205 [Acidobacteria bacterium]|nr:hypothetical protein [Acidobacteriota bacterium]